VQTRNRIFVRFKLSESVGLGGLRRFFSERRDSRATSTDRLSGTLEAEPSRAEPSADWDKRRGP